MSARAELDSESGSTLNSVPNCSIVSGIMPPNSSLLVAVNAVANHAAPPVNSVSDEMLSDKLLQVALYQQLECPPSENGGDSTGAWNTFQDIDFASTGRIPFRHLLRILKEDDARTMQSYADPASASFDFAQFVAFVEAAAAAIKRTRQA